MASINGVEIKGMKTYIGHEGEECVQGNVYLNGKKLGFWSQDGHGGPDRFEFDEKLLKDACEKFKAAFDDSYQYKEFCDSPEVFLGELVKVIDLEKHLAKGFRKGCKGAFCATDGFQMSLLWVAETDEETAFANHGDAVDEMKAELGGVFFMTPNGFDLTIDENHKPLPIMMV